MDTKSSSKQTTKKQTMAAEKQKKSSSKKKKKNKKPQSASKHDTNIDHLEIEGVGALDQPESDSSCPRQPGADSPQASQTTQGSSNSPDNNKIDGTAKVVTPSPSVTDGKKSTVSNTSLDESISTMTLKSSKSSQSVTKGSSSKTKINSGSKSGANSNGAKSNTKQSKVDSAKAKAAQLAAMKTAESLRWENKLQDEEKELERIRLYKINRRKRYLAAAQAKGLGWVVNYGSNGSPVAEDSGIEVRDRDIHTTVSDFSTVRSLIPASQTTVPIGLTTSEYMY